MNRKTQWVAGIICILFVAVVWTLATVLKQIIFNDLKFDEPLILAYVCNVCYAVHLPLQGLGYLFGCVERIPWRRETPDSSAAVEAASGSSIREAIAVGAMIAPIWFMAQWTYSAGVAGTSVTSSTVISTTSVVWTLLASVLFLGERFTCLKMIGVVACMGGNVATLWGNDIKGGQTSHFEGDLLCLAAAVAYAVYTTLLKRFTHAETSVALMFGSIGVFIIVIGTPFVLIFSLDGLRRMTWKIFGLLIFNGIFDNVLSQYAWAKAVQWTSPTAATVGLSLTIPLSVVADYVRKQPLTGWSFLAAGLVIVGFVAVTFASRPDEVEKSADAEAGASPRTPLADRPDGLNVVAADAA